ncbi:MAG: methylamine utilization protein [Methylococcaceae bacterium]|nr:methylamine utilization protein [Methylococcaceae bacterium]
MANRLSYIFLNSRIIILGIVMAMPAAAITMSGEVRDSDEAPVPDVVVTAMPVTGRTTTSMGGKPVTVRLDQQGREFVPHVLAVRMGTPVIFPNSDDIQHHVYSFSSTKRFEIKLYKNMPDKPIVFDKPGVVAIGCNIHDWMLGYIFVTEAPHVTKTDTSGQWALEVPEGEYRLSFWHPDADIPDTLPSETVQTPINDLLHHSIKLKTRRQTGKPPGSIQTQGYSDGF